jgi:hypothetical protein
MPRPVSEPSNDVTVYLVLNDHGQFGLAYDETDPAKADREIIIRNFLTGQYSDALRVVAFNTTEGWSRDVSEDIAGSRPRERGPGRNSLAPGPRGVRLGGRGGLRR